MMMCIGYWTYLLGFPNPLHFVLIETLSFPMKWLSWLQQLQQQLQALQKQQQAQQQQQQQVAAAVLHGKHGMILEERSTILFLFQVQLLNRRQLFNRSNRRQPLLQPSNRLLQVCMEEHL